MAYNNKGWHKESARHALASKGIKTSRKKKTGILRKIKVKYKKLGLTKGEEGLAIRHTLIGTIGFGGIGSLFGVSGAVAGGILGTGTGAILAARGISRMRERRRTEEELTSRFKKEKISKSTKGLIDEYIQQQKSKGY